MKKKINEKTTSLLLDKIDKEIFDILSEDANNEELIINRIEQLCEETKEPVLVNFFRVVSSLELSEEEAKHYWDEILKHKYYLSKKLERNVGFRVAMLDYFMNLNHILKKPKIIEIELYEITAKAALIDDLTGLYNRRFFNETLKKEINRAERHNHIMSLLLFDIDNFKRINDTFGHSKGDAILNLIGKLIKKGLRIEDTPCRYGGEEIAIILPETDRDKTQIIADRLNKKIYEACEKLGIKVTMSGGIASFPYDANEDIELFSKADTALYLAKNNGKNKIIPYNSLYSNFYRN